MPEHVVNFFETTLHAAPFVPAHLRNQGQQTAEPLDEVFANMTVWENPNRKKKIDSIEEQEVRLTDVEMEMLIVSQPQDEVRKELKNKLGNSERIKWEWAVFEATDKGFQAMRQGNN